MMPSRPVNTEKCVPKLVFVMLLTFSLGSYGDDAPQAAAPDQLSTLASQFVDLSQALKSIPDEQQKEQFLLFIDEIRKDLFDYEEATRRVYYAIPTQLPDRNEKKALKRKLTELDETLETIIKKLQQFKQSVSGADLYTEQSLKQASDYRSIAINTALEGIENLRSNKDDWNGTELRKMFAESIKTINAAQSKITEFQMGLDNQ